MTEPTTEPLPPADGTYYLADDVPVGKAVTVGFVGGREQKASHLYKDGQWVRLVLKPGGVVEHEPCDAPDGAPVGVPAAGHGKPVLISNPYEVAQGLERAKPVATVPERINPGPGVTTTVPQPAAASADVTGLVDPVETATVLSGGVVPDRDPTVVGIRKAPNRPRTGKGGTEPADEVASAAPLTPQ